MKILFIVTASGDSFYCGNCFRDNLHANAMRKAGHEVIVMPLYLPLKYESFKADTPLFFPATSFYAAQTFFSKRHIPKWLEKFLSKDFMLNVANSFSGTTSASGMESMTLSMIKGEGVAFNDQVNSLITWMKTQDRPDIVHFSSSLIIGVAKAIKQQLNIPVVCSLQDEEIWVDSLKEKYIASAWQSIVDNSKYVDIFIASSLFYKNLTLRKFPQINNIEVVYPGINRKKYASSEYPSHPTIGFFYRMNQENGLNILAEAFVTLKKRNSIENLKLKVGGGYTSSNKKFLKRVKKILLPVFNDVIWHDNYTLESHAEFYNEISVICVPITFEEGMGLYICESFAAGRPAVQPATGSFPETVGNAGILYEPNDSDSLANSLEKMLTNEMFYLQCRKNALQLSQTRYNDEIAAKKLEEMYLTINTSS